VKILCIGGGPAGLYFAILMKKADPAHQIVVVERNKVDDTFGFGVVFSDATMDNLAAADRDSYDAIRDAFYHWDDIDIFYRGERLHSTGHGFAGMSRQRLLQILADRAAELGVELRFETEITHPGELDPADLVIAADGVNSHIRELYSEEFEPRVDMRPNRFVWLGTTRPYPAFTFDFAEDAHGLWRLHAYQYLPEPDGDAPISTFIVEATDETFASAGLDPLDEAATLEFCERLFADHLDGHRLTANRSIWRRFPTVSNRHWHQDNVVLMGDAAHTAHFSVGSGTKLALEDAIALRDALTCADCSDPKQLHRALEGYEEERRPEVESLQRAAQASLQWFEDTERYYEMEPIQFGFTLLTRSLRITHEDLKLRDPGYVEKVDEWFAAGSAEQTGRAADTFDLLPRELAPMVYSGARRYPEPESTPPMFTPFKVRDLLLANRVVVSAMCQYCAVDGTPNEWHFVHLGSRAVGGAGLVMTEMTDISPEARITPGCAGLYAEEHVAAWRRITDFVHASSYARIGVQLAHAGRKGSTKIAWEGADEPLPEGGWPLVAPSPIPWDDGNPMPREMTRQDMDAVRDDFVAATQRAEQAGFDLIELHMAHGYLLSTFISPLTNRREDEYGGSLENRMRYPLEVLDAVREAWPDRPLFVRISAVDWAPGGMTADDAVQVARMLAGHGCDLVDVSAGQTVRYARPVYGRQFQTPFADRIRNEVGIATMAVGNISSFMDVNTILAAGRADLCALARAHLWDPYWTRNAAQKQGYPLPWPDPYSVLDGYKPRFE
jgi:anthraniloyl-CoA monooxygenase